MVGGVGGSWEFKGKAGLAQAQITSDIRSNKTKPTMKCLSPLFLIATILIACGPTENSSSSSSLAEKGDSLLANTPRPASPVHSIREEEPSMELEPPLQINNVLDSLDQLYSRGSLYASFDGQTYYFVNRNGRWGMLDAEFNELLSLQYDQIYNPDGTTVGWVEVEKGGKFGFFQYRQQKLIEPTYDRIFPGNSNRIAAYGQSGTQFTAILPDGSTRPAEASERPLYGENPRQWNFNLGQIKAKKLFDKGSSEYHIPTMARILVPSYLHQLGFLPQTIEPLNPTPGEIMADDAVTHVRAHVESSKTFGDKLTAFITNFFEAGISGRDYQVDKRYLTIVDQQNQIRDTLILGEDWAGNHPCGDFTVRFLDPQLIEVEETTTHWEDAPGEYTFATNFRYYQINDQGKTEPLDRPRKYDFTHVVLLEPRHFEGCFYLPLSTAEREKLSEEDYTNYTRFQHLRLEDLDLMRNEIFAEYGYRFKSEKWQQYFGSQDWYTPRYDNVDDQLTEIEKRNVQFILEVSEKLRENEEKYTQPSPAQFHVAG